MPGKNYCEIALCGRELPDGRGSKGGAMMCDACLSARGRIKNQAPEQIIERIERLRFWQERTETLATLVAKNAKKMQQQLDALRDESARLISERLREAKREIAKGEKQARAGVH